MGHADSTPQTPADVLPPRRVGELARLKHDRCLQILSLRARSPGCLHAQRQGCGSKRSTRLPRPFAYLLQLATADGHRPADLALCLAATTGCRHYGQRHATQDTRFVKFVHQIDLRVGGVQHARRTACHWNICGGKTVTTLSLSTLSRTGKRSKRKQSPWTLYVLSPVTHPRRLRSFSISHSPAFELCVATDRTYLAIYRCFDSQKGTLSSSP